MFNQGGGGGSNSRDKSIEPVDLVKQAYVVTSYYAMDLQVKINDGKRGMNIKTTFDNFRYGFLGLFNLVNTKSEFDNDLRKRVLAWKKIRTQGKISTKFCLQSLRLYDDFVKHLAFLKIID